MPDSIQIAAIRFVSPPRPVPQLSECFFYHMMDLPGAGPVGGSWDLRGRFDDYINHVDLRGKTVLDIGTGAGFLSFEAEKRGASVVSFDMDDKRRQHFLPYKGHVCYDDKEAYFAQLNVGYQRWKNAYWFAHDAFKSKARLFHGDIYNLPPELGSFDVVIAGCIMMHLANPIQALDSISRVSADKIIIIDTVDIHNKEPVARLESKADNPASGHFIWFVFTENLYREVFSMLGYELDSVSQKFYKCLDYYDDKGNQKPTDTLLTTIVASRRK